MYEFFEGKAIAIAGDALILCTGGIGYRIEVTHRDKQLLQIQCGKQVLIYVHPVIKEASHTLFGFLKKEERDCFALLLSVNGVGPKMGMELLGALEIEDIVVACEQGEHRAFTRVPGIGNKTACRLMLELKEKMAAFSREHCFSVSLLKQDVISALMQLGYSSLDATQRVTQVCASLSPPHTVEEILKKCLSQHFQEK